MMLQNCSVFHILNTREVVSSMEKQLGEKSPLVGEKAKVDNKDLTEHGKHGILTRLFPTGFKDEAKSIGRYMPGLLVCQMCQWFVQPIAIIFGGQLGKLELDAIGLACSLINVFGISIIWGTSAACDIAFSQTFGGKNKKMLGIYLQRCLMVLMLILPPCLAIHINIEGLLLVIGQDPEVCRLVGRYLLIFIPGQICMFLFLILQKYCMCQNIVNHEIWMGIVAHLIHAGLQYLFLYKLNLGTDGSALAQVCFYIICALIRWALVVFSKDARESWDGWSVQCFGGWGPLFRLAFAGGVMMCAEWWSYEIGTIVSGLLGATQLGAQTVIFNLLIIFNTISNAVASAGMIRMGHHLGAGQPNAAKTAGRVTLVYAMINGLLWTSLLLIFHKDVSKLFTHDQDVLETMIYLIPVLAGYVWADSLTVLGRLIFRVADKQKSAAIIIFITYYVCTLPLGFCLMLLTNLELFGLWLGYAICSIMTATIMTIGWNALFNWETISAEAQVRAHAVQEKQTNAGEDNITKSNREQKKMEEDSSKLNQMKADLKEEMITSWTTPTDYFTPEFPVTLEPVSRAEIIKCCIIIFAILLVLVVGIIIRLSTQGFIDQYYTGTSQNTTLTDRLFVGNKSSSISMIEATEKK